MDFFSAVLVLLAGMGYVVAMRRVVRSALAHPGRFPGFRWGTAEAWMSIAVAGFFVLTAALSFGREPAKINLSALESSLALYGGITIFMLGVLVSRNVPLVEAFGLKPAKPLTMGFAVAFALVFTIPAIYAAQWAAYSILGPETQPQPIVVFLMENPGWRERLAVAAIAIVAAPLTEELVFRGCLYGVVRQSTGRITAILLTSALFAVIHAHPATIPALLVLGIALALLYEATGSLWAPVLAHSAFNALNLVGSIFWPDLVK